MMKRIGDRVRAAMLAVAGNVSLFVGIAFFFTGVLVLGPQFWWREYVEMFERYVMIPWGMALCLLRLERRSRRSDMPARHELTVLFVLLVWVVVPFAIRFGNTFNNSGSWHTHTVLFFGVYATLAEATAEERERLFDLACAIFVPASAALGAALLYCAAAVQSFGDYEFAFGIVDGKYLSAFTHYNMTAMIVLCCVMMALCAFGRFRSIPMRAVSLITAVMMMVVTVLTQSRTARYALILALAAGAFSVTGASRRISRPYLRYAAALLAAVVVAVGGYVAADEVSNAAIAHYNAVRLERRAQQAEAAQTEAALADAEAQHETTADKAAADDDVVVKARPAANAHFSGRLYIWQNLINRWKEQPKYLLIGHGISRIGHLVTENTIHEGRESVSIHNAYLQYAADYGLIGFALLCAFLCIILVPVLRVFFARGADRRPGYTALCMLVIASLVMGMMESAPLSAMSPMNMMLFFSLALLCERGKDITPCKAR